MESMEPMTRATDETQESQPDPTQPSLPLIDGGRDAWLVLAACCVLEALVWGKIAVPTVAQPPRPPSQRRQT